MWAIVRFIRGEAAVTSVEYSVMLALILMLVLAAIGAVSTRSGGLWGGVVSSLQAAGP